MRIKNRFISAGFKLIYLAIAIYGMLLNIFAPGVEPGSVLTFYTLQGSILCITLTLLLLACELADVDYQLWRAYPPIKFCVLAFAIAGFILYHAVLEPTLTAGDPAYYGLFTMQDALIHTFTPVMLMLDYLLFDEKGKCSWWHPLAAALLPLLFAVLAVAGKAPDRAFAMFEGATRFFPGEAELPGTLLWLVLLTSGTVSGSYVLYALDHMLHRLFEAKQSRDAKAPQQ